MGTLDVLNRFHDRHAGASDLVFGGAIVREGKTSYDLLGERIPRDARRILDLACGDGPLLQRLRARPGLERLVGLDQSGAELDAARRRLGPGQELVRGLAAALPFEDGSFDAVSCHMALMLMDEAPRVLAELRRVLAPDGTLAFVVGRFTGQVPGPPGLWDWLRARWKEEGLVLQLGDDRWGSAEGIAALLGDAGFVDLCLEPLEARCSVPIGALRDFVVRGYYPVDALSEAGKEALADFIAARAPDWAPEGLVPWSFAIRLGSARRS